MHKLTLVAGAAIGYVLGARAGRQRYEQIKLQAGKAWQSPAVQEQIGKATAQLKEKGPEVAAAASHAAVKGAGDAAKAAFSAGVAAATSGKPKGPVVQGTLADGASYDAPGPDATGEPITDAAASTTSTS